MKKIICLISFFLSLAAARAQTLSIFDVDTSSFPVMKAKLYALDAEGKQVTNLNASDLSLSENGLPREILSISCPPVKPSERISSTIVIDVSGSMYGHPLDVAKTVAKTWVNALPLGQSDCAVVSFNGGNYFNQDFTTNRNKLLSAVDGLTSDDGTDYNAAMINPVAGGILTAKTAKYRKVIVFITDGMPNEPPNESLIISEALANGIMIHCITIGLPAHSSMVHFAEQTGGLLFENITTEEEAKNIAQMLLGRSVYDAQPCELKWKSDFACERRFIDVALRWNSLSTTAKYIPPESGVAKLVIEPTGVRFINKPIGKKADTTVSITAMHSDFNISGFISSDPRFSITPSNLTIPKGETRQFTLSFTPTDSTSCFSYIDIQNDRCAKKYFAASAYPKSKLQASTLKLTSPNGGEEFLVGTDTLITWEGVLPNDTVKLEYSYDNGATWNLITDSASGLKYEWKKVPRPTSAKCLVRISTNNNGIDIEWEKIYGGSEIDDPKEIIQTTNGYLVVGITGSKDGDIENFHGEYDVWALYLNRLGEPIWKKTLGGSSYDVAYSVKEMDDGSFVIGATILSDESNLPKGYGSGDYWIIRLDVNGKIIWSKSFGGTQFEHLFSIAKSSDGGIVAVGESSSNNGDVSGNHGKRDAWIIKLDIDGNLIWQKSVGGSEDDYAWSITQTNDNCAIIVGETYSNDYDIQNNQGKSDCWIAKINYDGNLMWSKTFGGTENDILSSIKETNDLGFIVSGYSFSNNGYIKKNHGGNDALVVKIDTKGDIQWIKAFGGSGFDEANSCIETLDNGYVFVGRSNSNDGDLLNTTQNIGLLQFWMVKLNNSSQIIWSKIFHNYDTDLATSVQQTRDEGFIVAGDVERDKTNKADILIRKFSPEQTPQSDVSDSVFSIVSPTVTALNIDMGQVVLGSYKDSVITAFIKNNSKYDCLIKDIKIKSKDFYVISNPSFTVRAGTDQAIEIHFKPSKLGKIYSNIRVETQDTSFSQSIEGEGVQPTLQINTALIDFGKVNVKELKDTVVVLLKNISGGAIDISDVKLLGPDTEQFEVLEGGGAFALTSGQTRELKLRFQPIYVGRTSCMLGFFHNGINSPAKAQLFGEGVENNVGYVYCEHDTAYPGEKVNIELILGGVSSGSLANLPHSFKAKLKYLSAPLSLLNPALKIGESADSTIIEVKGTIGADSVLYTIDFIANDTPKDFTTIDLEEIKWYDAGGSEIEYEAETQDGSFKLLTRRATVYCDNAGAYPGNNVTINLGRNGLSSSLQSVATAFKAKIRYLTAPLDIVNKALVINQTADSTTIAISGTISAQSILFPVEFISKDTDKDFTTIDIIDFKWLDNAGKEIICNTDKVSGSFRVLQYSGKATIFCTKDSAAAGEKVALKLKSSGIDPHSFKQIAPKFRATLRYQKTLLAPVDNEALISYEADSAYIVIASAVGESDELAAIDFIAGLGSVDSTSMDIADFRWINAAGDEIDYDTETESGSFKLLGVCREGGARLFNPTAKAGIEGLAPNPASHELTVTLNQVEEGASYLVVYNIYGKEAARMPVSDEVVGKKEVKIDLSGFSNGVYFIRFSTPTGSDVKKFVVDRK
ncbi:MAG: choice-of-anchor D domain-containing protein [Chloroflexota bacterium]